MKVNGIYQQQSVSADIKDSSDLIRKINNRLNPKFFLDFDINVQHARFPLGKTRLHDFFFFKFIDPSEGLQSQWGKQPKVGFGHNF